MSHKHDRLIRDIFHDPVSANIHWRDVESLLNHLGAEVIGSHGAALHVVLKGVEAMVHRPHHGGTCSKQDVRHLRELLAEAGVGPAAEAR
jgi:hypothetical protein